MSTKRKKNLTLPPGTQVTSPVTILNEVKQGIIYTFTGQSGPKNAPTFTYSVEFDNKKFIGEGKNKNLAKAAAAKCALQSIIHSPKNNSTVKKIKTKKITNFNSDKNGLKKPTFEECCIIQNQSSKLPAIIAEQSVAILNEIYPGLTYQFVTQSGPKHAPIFTYLIEFDGKKFIRHGKTKILAKYAVAESALQSIIFSRKNNAAVDTNKINSTVNFTGDNKNHETLIHDESSINYNESSLPTIIAERSVAILSKIQQDLKYQFIGQSDSKHAPIFTYSVEFDGKNFIGEGRNKNKAKTAAAECALLYILHFSKNISKINTNAVNNTTDFIKDGKVYEKPTCEESRIIQNQTPKLPTIVTKPSVAILKEITQETIQSGPKLAPIFTFSIEFDGTKFIVKEKNKNLPNIANIHSSKNYSKVETNTVCFTGDNTDLEKSMNKERDKNGSLKIPEIIAERSVTILNQIHPGLTYKFIGQSDPENASIFTYSVEFDCMKLIDDGKNKTLAKAAIPSIIHSLTNNSTVDTNAINFSSDNKFHDIPLQGESGINDNESSKLPVVIIERSLAILNQIYQGLIYKLISQSGSKLVPLFTYSVEFEGTKFIGEGKNMALAKAAATERALQSIIHSLKTNSTVDTSELNSTANFTSDNKVHEKPTYEEGCIIQNRSIAISKEVEQETNQLSPKHSPIFTFSVEFDGTKFIGKEKKKNLAKAPIHSPKNDSTVDTSAVSFIGDNTDDNKPMNDDNCINDSESSKLPEIIAERSVAILNQIHPGLTFQFIGQSDLKNASIFTYSVELDCTKLIDDGKSKILANVATVECALQNIIHSLNLNSVNTVNEKPMEDESCMNHNTLSKLPEIIAERSVAILNQIYRGLIYKFISQSGSKCAPLFTYSVEFEGTKFIGEGTNQNLAKVAATKCALQSIKHSLKNNLTVATNVIKNTANSNSVEKILEKPTYNKSSKLPTVISERSVAILNQIHPGIAYKLIGQTGLKHTPTFTYSVEFDNKKFIGEGKSKNQAKYAAAECALQSIIHCPKNSTFETCAINSTADIPLQGEIGINDNESSELPEIIAERSVAIINQIHPGLTYKFIGQSDPKNASILTCSVDFDGIKFIGEGKNKNLAKTAAAKCALLYIIHSPKIDTSAIKNTADFTSDNKVNEKPTCEESFIIQNQTPKLPTIVTEKSVPISKEIQQGLTYEFIGQLGSKLAPLFTYQIELDGKKFIGQEQKKCLAKLAVTECVLESVIQSSKNNHMVNTSEIKRGLTYQLISQSGPQHAPTFIFSVEFDGKKYIGEGKNKNLAKAAAAECALLSIIHSPKINTSKKDNTVNLTDDTTVHDKQMQEEKCMNHNESSKLPTVVAEQSVAILNLIYRGLIYQFINQSGSRRAPIFTYSVEIGDTKFIGEGKNKNLAKVAAAECALQSIIHSPKNNSNVDTGQMYKENFRNDNASSKLPDIIAERSVAILNQIYPGLTYQFIGQSGPKYAPIFTYSVELDNKKFIGEGKNKVMAKYIAAECALQSIIHSPKNSSTVNTNTINNTSVNAVKPMQSESFVVQNQSPKLPSKSTKRSVAITNDIQQGLTYQFIGQSGSQHAPIFTYSVELYGKKFIGEGKTKNLAKSAAAECALQSIIHSSKNNSTVNTNAINNTSGNTVKPMQRGSCVVQNQSPKLPSKSTKRSVAITNDIQGLSYQFIGQSGPQHAPIFTYSVEFYGKKFIGEGKTKNLAKSAAAECALQSIIHSSKNNSTVNTNAINNTSGNTVKPMQRGSCVVQNQTPKLPSKSTKRSVAITNDIQGLSYQFIGQSGPQHAPIFTYSVEFYGKKFIGEGKTKNLAKSAAAKCALQSIIHSSKNNSTVNTNAINNTSGNTVKPMQRGSCVVQNQSPKLPSKSTKRSVAITNDIQGLSYQFIGQSGPQHAPIFTYSVEFYGKKFIGEGKTKNLAKSAAAECALQSIMHSSKNNSTTNTSAIKNTANLSNDKTIPKKPAYGRGGINKKPSKKLPSSAAEGPVAILNEMFPGLTYVCECLNDSVSKFKMTVKVKGQLFFGIGRSKKLAKEAVARAALSKICNMPSNVDSSSLEYTQKRSVLQKSVDLTRKNTTIKKHEVIASITMSENYSPESSKLTYVTSTEYISGDHINVQETSINDMRAEIEARKYLIDLLRKQLEILPSLEAESKMENGNKETRKRPLEDQSEMSMKRKKTLILSPVTLATKSPVAILNEVKQGLTYQLISQSGPTHAPLFAYSVDIDGEKFIGEGKNKKLAKAAAARNALQSFIQFPKNNSMVNISTINDNVDFTSDDIVQEKPKNGVSNIVQSPKIPAVVAKGPVMILNEMFPGLTYECESLNDSVAKFKMSVEVKGELFFGTGGSKKHAKAAAARAALSKICNMSPSTFSMPNVNSSPSGLMHKRTIPQMLVDYIGELVLQKFDSLTRDNTTIQKRKVIAGIVMTENYSLESAKLICVTTGTKCISGDHISVQGAAINDTHAEIVARRCLIDFLYTQLENLSSFGTSSKETIFKPRDDNSNGYTLKEGIKFHLYINTAPCGDARIFSPHEIEDKGLLDKHPNRKARGQLRTKIESGEGTIPVASSGGIQTWDGVLQGERLLTMSCSDKICRWNVLGVQGALLTNFIDPIYLDSIILGSLLHPEHMCRAIYGRIETTIQALPPPFKLNKPETNLLSSSETRRAAKAPNFSVNWTVGLPEAEVINSMTGKTEYGGMSRICKQMFFRRFLNLVGNIKSLTKFPENEVITMYSQAKQLAGDYQTAKKQLYMAFEKAYLGAWLKKPIEQDQFEL